MTHGITEEVGSLVVIGRLWRIFKIIEEFSTASEEQMDGLQERVDHLEEENKRLEQASEGLRHRLQAAGHDVS